MQVEITCPLVISFCKKHPTFSIQKLVTEFVTNVSTLDSDESDGILASIKDIFQEGVAVIKDSLKIESCVIIDGVKNGVKDTNDNGLHESLGVIQETLAGIPKQDYIHNVIQGVPNLITESRLQEIIRKLDTTVTSETIKTIPNETMLSELRGLREEFDKYTSLFKTGSVKGRSTELKVMMQLDNVFPKHDIISVPSSKQKGKMDLILSRSGFPDISIDTKNYTKTVPKSEVEKFERDILSGGTHGILISVSSKITGKPHFTIDIIKGKVGIYLSCTGGDTDCIALAVDLIYTLDKCLECGDGTSVSKSDLDEIQKIIIDGNNSLEKVRGMLKESLEELRKVNLERITRLLVFSGVD
jgi:hypothetical protein